MQHCFAWLGYATLQHPPGQAAQLHNKCGQRSPTLLLEVNREAPLRSRVFWT